MDGCKQRDDMAQATSQDNDLCNSILNWYQQSKSAFVKAEEKDTAVTEMWDDENLDKSFSCIH